MRQVKAVKKEKDKINGLEVMVDQRTVEEGSKNGMERQKWSVNRILEIEIMMVRGPVTVHDRG